MFENLCIHTVNVLRPTAVKGSSGAEQNVYTAVYTNLACRVETASASWLIQYSRKAIDVSHQVYFPQNPTILNGDQIVFGSRTFEVKGPRNAQEDGRLIIVDVVELT